MVAALEAAWAQIREYHPELPRVFVVLGSGSLGKVATLGHFASLRWNPLTRDSEHPEPAGDSGPHRSGPHRSGLHRSGPHRSEPDRSESVHELAVSGEGLARGPAEVFGTMLHEAAHARAWVLGIGDTSRGGRYHNTKYRDIARDTGLVVEQHNTYGWTLTSLTPASRERYAEVIDQLGSALRLVRIPEPSGGTSESKSKPVAAECGCGRKIRVARTVFALGPIRCGVCDTEFTDPDSADPDSADGESADGEFTDELTDAGS